MVPDTVSIWHPYFDIFSFFYFSRSVDMGSKAKKAMKKTMKKASTQPSLAVTKNQVADFVV